MVVILKICKSGDDDDDEEEEEEGRVIMVKKVNAVIGYEGKEPCYQQIALCLEEFSTERIRDRMIRSSYDNLA
jgi:hypothetical protein